MRFYLFAMIMYMFSLSRSFNILSNISPKHLRKFIKNDIDRTYKYLSYEKVKKILHNKIKRFDLYGDYNDTNTMNVEHIFPQKYFKNHIKKKYMKSDLHHLYLSDEKINSHRQFYKYIDPMDIDLNNDEILDNYGNKITCQKQLFNKQGYVMIKNTKSQYFIPIKYSRGKIARALSYFAIKYDYIEELTDVIDTKTLLLWNMENTVDENEYLKNIVSYRYQHNFNPFIINPEIMPYCFSDITNINELHEDLLNSNKYVINVNNLSVLKYIIGNINNYID